MANGHYFGGAHPNQAPPQPLEAIKVRFIVSSHVHASPRKALAYAQHSRPQVREAAEEPWREAFVQELHHESIAVTIPGEADLRMMLSDEGTTWCRRSRPAWDLAVGSALYVETEGNESHAVRWLPAEVREVLPDGQFRVCIDGDEEFDSVLKLDEEHFEWVRAVEGEAVRQSEWLSVKSELRPQPPPTSFQALDDDRLVEVLCGRGWCTGNVVEIKDNRVTVLIDSTDREMVCTCSRVRICRKWRAGRWHDVDASESEDDKSQVGLEEGSAQGVATQEGEGMEGKEEGEEEGEEEEGEDEEQQAEEEQEGGQQQETPNISKCEELRQSERELGEAEMKAQKAAVMALAELDRIHQKRQDAQAGLRAAKQQEAKKSIIPEGFADGQETLELITLHKGGVPTNELKDKERRDEIDEAFRLLQDEFCAWARSASRACSK
eukprot:7298674-Prymnesium_polylepis.1